MAHDAAQSLYRLNNPFQEEPEGSGTEDEIIEVSDDEVPVNDAKVKKLGTTRRREDDVDWTSKAVVCFEVGNCVVDRYTRDTLITPYRWLSSHVSSQTILPSVSGNGL